MNFIAETEPVWTGPFILAFVAALFAGLTSLVGLILSSGNRTKLKTVTNQVEVTDRKVDVIHIATNGAMTAQMKTLAEVTAAKAAITKDVSDMAAAKKAMEDYLDHVGKISKSVPEPPPNQQFENAAR